MPAEYKAMSHSLSCWESTLCRLENSVYSSLWQLSRHTFIVEYILGIFEDGVVKLKNGVKLLLKLQLLSKFCLFVPPVECLSLTVMIRVQSLTVEACFHIHLQTVESFSALIENPILMDGSRSMISDIINSLEASIQLTQK